MYAQKPTDFFTRGNEINQERNTLRHRVDTSCVLHARCLEKKLDIFNFSRSINAN